MIEINPWMILVQLVSFLVLMAVLARFLFSPLAKFIEKRRNEINNTFSLINEEKEKSGELIEKAEKRLKDAGDEAKKIIEKAIKEGEVAKDEILKKAKQEAETMAQSLITNTKNEIKKEKQNAISYIGKISIAIAGKLTKEAIDEKRADALLSEFIESIKEEDIKI
ncbi:MAG: F0F1 ATP synthase subunit B [bacterium]